MFAVSLNEKWADVSVRERAQRTAEELPAFLDSLRENGVGETVWLATCGRVELYGTGDAYRAAELFAGDRAEIRRRMLLYDGDRAVRHLFRVASGLESVAVGEDEILGQVKKAFAKAADSGNTGYELNTVFRAAITAAKRVKTETLLSKSSVSIATLAAARCERWKPGRKTALVIGATGEIGGKTLLDLLSYGDFELCVTSRGGHSALPDGVRVVDYENRYEALSDADIVVSATRSPGCTVEAGRILTQRPRLYVDLAVPRDIDPEVSGLDGAELVTVDDLKSLAYEHMARKQDEIRKAEEILAESAEQLKKELTFHAFLPQFRRSEGMERFFRQFRDAATPEEFRVFAEVLSRMDGME